MKRANGTGTIVKKKGRRKPYIAYGPASAKDGKRYVPYIGSYESAYEAQRALERYNDDPTVLKEKLTFSQVFEEFKSTKHYKQLSKSMQDCYCAAYRSSAALHDKPMAQLRTVHMQSVIDEIEQQGKSLSTLQKVKVIFTVLSKYALQNDIIKKDYSVYVELPKIEQNERRSLTDIELTKIKNAAENGNKTAKWVMYLCFSGWRISEMLELKRSDYDEDNKAFRGGKKTKYGKNRVVPVHSSVQWIVDEQLALGGETVFCMPNGKPMTADYFRKHLFDDMLTDIGIDPSITPHYTRHTFATLLKKNGADEFFTKKLIGHSDKDITSVYTHAEIENLKSTIELMSFPAKKKTNENGENIPEIQKKISKTVS